MAGITISGTKGSTTVGAYLRGPWYETIGSAAPPVPQ